MTQYGPGDPGHPPGAPVTQHSKPLLVALVLAGGVLGTLARYGISVGVPEAGGWPVPTLLVNLGGSFLLGVLLEWLAFPRNAGRAQLLRLGAGTGFLGAFTTYSAFAFDAVSMLDAGRIGAAAAYVSLSVLGGIACAAVGVVTASRWRGDRPEAGTTQTGTAPPHPRQAP
ncbi:CrcB protein [Arthrobacter sp. CAN_A6]|uniref:fluoride efflux transporter FluC n=1 Tax=Arthrobacter sp. CAN_A6 TaxID=2787721 RepID=UPI0018C9D63A